MKVDNCDDVLAEGKAVLEAGARCLSAMAAGLDHQFTRTVELILAGPGQVILTGIGKAGDVARKISGTFASTGTPSIYLHPTDALHGDLGRVRKRDLVLALSNSGSSQEITRLIPPLRSIGATLVAITAVPDSMLATEADVALCYGRQDEAGHLGLAPTTSTTAMLALGDALAMAVLSQRHLSLAEFARYHPGGALGKSLMRVAEVMRKGDRNPVADENREIFHVLHLMSATRGRPGAASLVDEHGKLSGFYTDGDFRRTMENLVRDEGGRDARVFFRRPIKVFMTRDPIYIKANELVAAAVHLLSEKKIDQLPVVDDLLRPIGLIDVQDLLDVRVLG